MNVYSFRRHVTVLSTSEVSLFLTFGGPVYSISRRNENWQGKQEYSDETRPSYTQSSSDDLPGMEPEEKPE
jgi:hypothetical protein